MLIYLCGNGSDEKFEAAEIDVRDAGHTPINPVRFNQMIDETNKEKQMRVGLALLDICSGIYLVDGFETDSAASNREIGYAMAKGMQFFDSASLVRENY